MHEGLPDDAAPDWMLRAAWHRAYAWHKRHFPNNHESAAFWYAEKYWHRFLDEVEQTARAELRESEERKHFRWN